MTGIHHRYHRRERRAACHGSHAGKAQRGVAIVSVLLLVALATFVVSSLFWREHVTLRSVENRLALAQLRWIERAVLDWAAVVLQVDRNHTGGVDHLGEIWALPIAETVLDETVTGGARLADDRAAPRLAGQIFDAQARLNLNGLVIDGVASEIHRRAFERLLALLGRPPALASNLQTYLLQIPAAKSVAAGDGSPTAADPEAVSGTPAAVGDSARQASGGAVLPLLFADDLARVPGFDAATIDALEPFIIFLPTQVEQGNGRVRIRRTQVNINTAPAEVIAACVPGLELHAARRFVEGVRERTYFASLETAASRFDEVRVLPADLLSTGSSFFLVQGVIRFGRIESNTRALLYRGARQVELVWQDRS